MGYYNYSPYTQGGYYGRGYQNYPVQLNSGVNFVSQNPIDQGLHSLISDLTSIQQAKNLDEQKKINDFNKLIDVSLKGVNGRFRDEAVKLRNDFITKARDMTVQNKGNFTWEQQKQLEQEKDNLNNFAGMYNDIQNWAKQAINKAIQIKDPDAKVATMKNITDILERGGNLQQTWEKTRNPNWYVPEIKKYDIQKDILGKINDVLTRNGNPNTVSYQRAVKTYLKYKDPAFTWLFEKQKEANPKLTEDEFAKQIAQRKAAMVQPKYKDPTIQPSPKNGGLNAKGEYYNYNGKLYHVHDPRPVIVPNEKKEYKFEDSPIKVNSWTTPDDKTFKNGNIIGVKKQKGKWYALVSHDTTIVNKDKENYIKKYGLKAWNALIASGLQKPIGDKKDVIHNKIDLVPLSDVQNLIDRHYRLKDLNDNAVSPEYKENVMKAIDSKANTANKKDPFNILK